MNKPCPRSATLLVCSQLWSFWLQIQHQWLSHELVENACLWTAAEGMIFQPLNNQHTYVSWMFLSSIAVPVFYKILGCITKGWCLITKRGFGNFLLMHQRIRFNLQNKTGHQIVLKWTNSFLLTYYKDYNFDVQYFTNITSKQTFYVSQTFTTILFFPPSNELPKLVKLNIH